MSRHRKLLSHLLTLLPLLLLAGCKSELLMPAGDIALQQRNLLIQSTVLMLLIIIPVIVLTLVFAWRYRQGNKKAVYEPNWDHSTQLELIIWAAPLLIIICLGALTWIGTHLLDPYRPVSRLAKDQPIVEEVGTLQVNVVALDWKWLFIYPEYGVATVNELVLPVNKPISLHITSSNVMNSLYVPAFAGMVYAMPGMETRLHGVMNRTGEFEGFSANYSGAGFSGMHFKAHSLNDAEFAQWVATTKNGSDALSREVYLTLAKPSEKEPVRRYASVETGLFKAVVDRCVEPNKMCQSDMMAYDAKGGLGLASVYNLAPLNGEVAYQSAGGAGKSYVTGICTPESQLAEALDKPVTPADMSPLRGAGLPVRSLLRTAAL